MWEEDFGALNYSPVVFLLGPGKMLLMLWFRAGLITCETVVAPGPLLPLTAVSIHSFTNSWTDTFPSFSTVAWAPFAALPSQPHLHQHALIEHSEEPASLAETFSHRLPCEPGAQCNLTQTETFWVEEPPVWVSWAGTVSINLTCFTVLCWNEYRMFKGFSF